MGLTTIKYILSVSIAVYMTQPASSQMRPPIKYKDNWFPAISLEKNLSYFTGPASGKKGRSTLFDLYQPKQDSTPSRPLIIWMHGGGFKFGSKETRGIRLWSAAFAGRGYVCAAVNYRLGRKNLTFNFTELVKNCYGALQDVQQAILFFKNNCTRFRIDTTRIILAGNSAGAIIALQGAYSNEEELVKLMGGTGPGNGSGGSNPANVAAVINFWGGIFDTAWLRNTRVPIVSVHGSKDRIVPYDHKGFTLYGSLAIHNLADSLHIPNRLKVYEGYSHELQKHFNPLIVSAGTRKRWQEAGQFAADFLYEELFSGRRSRTIKSP
jgi:dienelactone hydrolase